MKTITSVLMVIIFSCTICNVTEAQIKNPFKKVQREAEKKANKEIDKGIENAMSLKSKKRKRRNRKKSKRSKSRSVMTLKAKLKHKMKVSRRNWIGRAMTLYPVMKSFLKMTRPEKKTANFLPAGISIPEMSKMHSWAVKMSSCSGKIHISCLIWKIPRQLIYRRYSPSNSIAISIQENRTIIVMFYSTTSWTSVHRGFQNWLYTWIRHRWEILKVRIQVPERSRRMVDGDMWQLPSISAQWKSISMIPGW